MRTDFRSTIFWQPDIITGKDGKATIAVNYPDSLTGWKATARAVTAANQFGIATAGTRTKQPLIVRLEAPRFFVVGDQATLSAVVNNNTDQKMEVPRWRRKALTKPGFMSPNGVVGERAFGVTVEGWRRMARPASIGR